MRKTMLFMLLALFTTAGSLRSAPPQQKPASTAVPDQPLTQNRVSRAQLMVYKNVYAAYGPYFVFDDLKLTVKEYTFVLVKKNGPAYMEAVKGSQLTATIRAKLKEARAGDLVLLTQVKVSGQAGEMVLDGPTLTVY